MPAVKRKWALIPALLLAVMMCSGSLAASAFSPNPDSSQEPPATPSSVTPSTPSSVTPDAPDPAPGETETETEGLPVLLIACAIGGGVLVLGGAALLLVMVMRKKPGAGSAASAQRGAGVPVLIGNAHHVGARESQQDSFCISDIFNAELFCRKGALGVVADGMGGMADGAEVSAVVTRTMLRYFNEAEFSGQPGLDLLNMLYAANDNVNRLMAGREKGGSTVVAVILYDGKMVWVSVGDSRIYLIRGGAVIQLNREHVYGVELDERAAMGEISWEEAAGDSRRAALTSYLGIDGLKQVDRNAGPMQLLPGDRVLLMSDGVFGVLSDGEILSCMLPGPQESADRIGQMILAKQKPNQDNFTAIILENI